MLLVQALGVAVEQVHELLDFYHAVQHIGQVAALRKDWSAKARTRWRTNQRRLLLQGQVEQVIAAIQVSVEAATARPCVRSGTTSSRTRAAWRMRRSWL